MDEHDIVIDEVRRLKDGGVEVLVRCTFCGDMDSAYLNGVCDPAKLSGFLERAAVNESAAL